MKGPRDLQIIMRSNMKIRFPEYWTWFDNIGYVWFPILFVITFIGLILT